MAAATARTKWRRLVKTQLKTSDLPIINEMFYRQYVNVIYQIAINNNFGKDIFRIERMKLLSCLHLHLSNQEAFSWEQDLILYTASLLMDNTEGKISPAFQGASLICGECLLPVKINNDGTRYVCAHCNAQVKAGPNRIPLGIPASQEIRFQRNRLHQKLDTVMGYRKKIPVMRDKYYRRIAEILDIPYELTHIGFVINKKDVFLWDLAIDSLEEDSELCSKEMNNV